MGILCPILSYHFRLVLYRANKYPASKLTALFLCIASLLSMNINHWVNALGHTCSRCFINCKGYQTLSICIALVHLNPQNLHIFDSGPKPPTISREEDIASNKPLDDSDKENVDPERQTESQINMVQELDEVCGSLQKNSFKHVSNVDRSHSLILHVGLNVYGNPSFTFHHHHRLLLDGRSLSQCQTEGSL